MNLVSNIGFGETATNCKEASPRANLPTEEMVWPLKHPPGVFRSRKADRYTQEAIYEDRLPARQALVNSRSLRRERSSYDGEVDTHEAFQIGGVTIPAWAAEMSGLGPEDASQPIETLSANVCLNRARLARFLSECAGDGDVRDFAALDVMACATGIPLSFTAEPDSVTGIVRHPINLWQHVWLYKTLGLRAGGLTVLDVGGPAAHLTVLAAAAGNHVASVHGDPRVLAVGRRCAVATGVAVQFQASGIRSLDGLPSESFERVLCCSVLEHLTVDGQREAVAAMARVLRPGGVIGITFDCGPAAPGATALFPPPHEPPASIGEARLRYATGGLEVLGAMDEGPVCTGSLYRDGLQHSVCAMFLGKAPLQPVAPPRFQLPGSLVAPFADPYFLYRSYRMALEAERNAERTFSRFARLESKRTELQAIAQERLTALEATAQALEIERRQSEMYRVAAEERLRALLETDAALRRERAAREG